MDDQQTQNPQTRRIAIGLASALVLVAAAWWYWHRPTQEPAAAAAPTSSAATLAEPAAGIRYPLAEAAAAAAGATPAPAPSDPDAAVEAALSALFGGQELAGWLIPDKLARRLVATTDNLSRNARLEPTRPLRAPAGPFAVQREAIDTTIGSERITMSAQNAARYDAAVSLLSKTDMKQAATVYRRIYPTLQQAYEDLGYPDRYFNDRVVDTIDHLLATPEPAGPLLLEQPKVLYRFADPDLEARSSGQKLLLRMGVAHAREVKQKLREFRDQVSSKE
ncbi:MAG: DUF3014 domain-containing protein [Steroidobacteraceae bacterium]